MYLVEKDKELTQDELRKILNQFHTKDIYKLKKWKDYYDGKQKILFKKATDEGKPCNKIVVNYAYNIVKNYSGYITGIPVKYDNDNFKDVIEVLKYNDVATEDNELLLNALIYGVAYEIAYVDEDGKQRFKVLDSRSCIPVYDNTLNNDLQYVIRFWEEQLADESGPSYRVEVYGPNTIKRYRSTPGFTSFELIGEPELHFYGQCPISVFKLNDDEVSIFNQIMTLQDSYNQLLSDEVDDFDSFADAYLVLKGAIADEEQLANMKRNRVLMMDPDASAGYLTKSISDTQISNMLQNVNNQIHKISNSPDFNDEKFMAQSGIAMRYKLLGFENEASNIETNMRKALQKRIELICTILKLTDSESSWRDVEIRFTRNLPLSIDVNNMTITDVNSLRGLVSDRTLISLLPFISNVDEEIKQLEEEKASNIDAYSLGFNIDEREE